MSSPQRFADGAALVPVRPADTDWLYHLLVVTAGGRWRFRGATPSPGDFAAQLWAGVHVQFVVCGRDGARLGLVGLYDTDLRAQHTHVFAVAEPGAGPVVSASLASLVSWAFDEFDLVKVYVEAAEFNLEQFASLARFANVEGRLVNHRFWRGRFYDTVIMSVSAQRFAESVVPAVRGAAAADRTAAPRDGSDLVALVEDLVPLDSLSTVELLGRLEERFEVTLDAQLLDGLDLLDADSVEAVAAELWSRVEERLSFEGLVAGQRPAVAR